VNGALGGFLLSELAFVNFAAMADLENKNHQSVMFEGANDAVISHPVFPESAPASLEAPSDLSWIFQICDSVA
jgi:hypothetical protein